MRGTSKLASWHNLLPRAQTSRYALPASQLSITHKSEVKAEERMRQNNKPSCSGVQSQGNLTTLLPKQPLTEERESVTSHRHLSHRTREPKHRQATILQLSKFVPLRRLRFLSIKVVAMGKCAPNVYRLSGEKRLRLDRQP